MIEIVIEIIEEDLQAMRDIMYLKKVLGVADTDEGWHLYRALMPLALFIYNIENIASNSCETEFTLEYAQTMP